MTLKAGASIKITTDDAFKEKCTSEVLWLDYKNITKVMEPGKRLFIDDGLISVKCTEIGSDHFIGLIENDGNLGSKKGCNLPEVDVDLPALSEKDKADLAWGVGQARAARRETCAFAHRARAAMSVPRRGGAR